MKSGGVRRALGYATLIVVLYAAFLVATLPASWAGWALARDPSVPVHLNDALGTVWRGHGQLGLRGTSTELGVLTWRVKPLWLLAGRLKLAWNLGGHGLDGGGNLTLTYGQAKVHELAFRLPATEAHRLYPFARLFGPEGTITLSSPGWTIHRGVVEGAATLHWQDAGSQRYGISQLGQYQLTAQGDGANVRLTLATVRGDLELVGKGQWNALGNGRLQLRGTARARAREEELEPMLRMLGPDTGGGRRAFSFNLPLGTIRLPGLR